MTTKPQEIQALVTYFVAQYTKKVGTKPVVNRNRARWRVQDMLMDMSIDEAKGLIDYYFETVSTNGHSLDWFLNNYDHLAVARTSRDADQERLRMLREASKKRAEEWRKKIGKDRTTDS